MEMITEISLIVGLWTFEALTPLTHQPLITVPTGTEKLVYEFKADGSDRLHWSLLDEGQFCERTGTYTWADNQLTTTITAVNPANHQSCSSDPDMVVGTQATTPARIENDKLILTLKLGVDEVEMSFTRNPPMCPKSTVIDAAQNLACG